jgi:hypothetical protein
MAITPSGSVRINKPADVSTGEMMNQLRDWLDANRIQPALFTTGVQTNGTIAFEITFVSAEHAARFNSQFG